MKAVEIFFTIFNIILGIVNLAMHMANRRALEALEKIVGDIQEESDNGR